MSIQLITNNLSLILAIICALCVVISVITEFTKEIGFLNRIPTMLQVLVLSVVVCLIAFFAFASYMQIRIIWYYVVAVIFISFIVALITAKGWDYLIEIIRRFWRKDLK
ncbi:MAG: hypothetical protein NC247_01970 [Ruminococcus flavefaciens]|nr:hypothetical protein [Ruminococcus flavefaciens]